MKAHLVKDIMTVEVLSVAPLFAEIIRRLHAGRPLLDLLIL